MSGLIGPLRPITRENHVLSDSVVFKASAPVDPAGLAKPAPTASELEPTQLVRGLEPTRKVPAPPAAPRLASVPARPAPNEPVEAARVEDAPAARVQVIVGDAPDGSGAFSGVTVVKPLQANAELEAPRSSAHQVPLPDRRPIRAEDLLGTTLGGYTLDDLVGSRREEWTYGGRQQGTNAPVVVKVLPPPARPRRATAELCRQTMAIKRLGHRNIVRVMDLVEDADKLSFIVLEQPAGMPLSARLSRNRRLAPRQAVAICLQICDALAAAHAIGLTPADINLDSIFLTRSGRRSDRVKIHDLGLRDPDRAPSCEASDPLTGSAWFRSPEERNGAPTTAASNIYSVGALLCYMLGGHADREVPPALAEIVIRCMSADPTRRFSTMVAVRAALERATGELEHARKARREARRRPGLPLGIALLALVLALAALVGVVALSNGADLAGLAGRAASIANDGAPAEVVVPLAAPKPVTEALPPHPAAR